MSVITLTSDLGTTDYYAAALKASILRLVPTVNIIDITHEIPPFNIARAAFVLRNVWKDFPEGSIHLIGIDTQWSRDSPFVLIKRSGHYFIGTDNGLFSLIFDEPGDAEVYDIGMKGDENMVFPSKAIFVPVAAALLQNESPEELGQRKEAYKVRPGIKPVVAYDNIRGTVIYVDTYGNVITNITRELFEREVGDQPFSIVLRKGDRDLTKICRSYQEVPEGEKVATFTSAGYLEIAINKGVEGSGGGASGLLGLRENDVVRIEFDKE